jgi:hypothetical protein
MTGWFMHSEPEERDDSRRLSKNKNFATNLYLLER